MRAVSMSVGSVTVVSMAVGSIAVG